MKLDKSRYTYTAKYPHLRTRPYTLHGPVRIRVRRESVSSGLDYWTGLLDWTTGLTFDLKSGKIVKESIVCVCREEGE